jgi:Leu/Phe-tRNA-protein transferase
MTPHLEQFGAESIPRREFHLRLAQALSLKSDFLRMDVTSGAQVLQATSE